MITSIRCQEARIREVQSLLSEDFINEEKRTQVAQKLLRMRLTRKVLLTSLLKVLAESKFDETYQHAKQLYHELIDGDLKYPSSKEKSNEYSNSLRENFKK